MNQIKLKRNKRDNTPICGCINCINRREYDHPLRKKESCSFNCKGSNEQKYDLIIKKYDMIFYRNNRRWKYNNFELHPNLIDQVEQLNFIKIKEFTI